MKKQIIKPIDGKQAEKAKKTNKVLNIGLVIMFFAYTLLAVWMGANFDFQSPIIFQSPITRKVTSANIEDQTPIIKLTTSPTPSPTRAPAKRRTMGLVTNVFADEGYVDIKKVYQLESSSGKNDSCKSQGKFNGYGFGQNSSVWNCFDTFEEVTTKVQNWFSDKEVKGYSVAEALCGYNLGFASPHFKDCVSGSDSYPYYRNYMSIK